MADWKTERANKYPRLNKIVKLLTEKESLVNDEKIILDRLEEVADKLSWERIVAKELGEQPKPKKKPTKYRQKQIRTRIKVGLIRWIAIQRVSPIEKICREQKLVSVNTYYTYQSEGLGYTEVDIAALGTNWVALWETLMQGKDALEKRIDELIEERKLRF